MAAIGIALLWGAYTAGLYGYCLFRGYNVTPAQLLSSAWPPGSDVKKAGKGVGQAIDQAGKIAKGK